MRRTKIVCTIGPASSSVDILKDLILSGMSCARINFSHGDYASHEKTIAAVKEAREELSAPIPLLLDMKGPEIRTGLLEDGNVELVAGDKFILTTEPCTGNKDKVSISYAGLPQDVSVGCRILIDDGLIEMEVMQILDKEIHCIVRNGGELGTYKGVNIPDVYLNLPALEDRDREDLKFGISHGVDFVAASFVRSANDVVTIRQVLEENGGSHIQIISKIENRDGVSHIDEILEVSDGIMVARGDLGVEIPPEEVPIVQKYLIEKANASGKLVITATQMLESMVSKPRPTRAEANDVANAIMDGSDAVMLSGETAKGDYPVESVQMMARIISKTESSINYVEKLHAYLRPMNSITNAICYAACTAAAELQTACIATVTSSGFTSKQLARFRPYCPVVACCVKESVWRQMSLVWGVRPELVDKFPSDDEVFSVAIDKACSSGLAQNGDTVVIAAGTPVGKTGATNTLKVSMVGGVLAKGKGIGMGIVSGPASVIKVFDEASRLFKMGDILVTSVTTNEWIPYIKKAKAVVVGPVINAENCHAEIVCQALDIPVIICNSKVIDAVENGSRIVLDLDKGLVFSGSADNPTVQNS